MKARPAVKILLLALAALTLGLTGCEYVNVPQQSGDIANNDPNRPIVQRITVEALKAVAADRPIEGVFAIKLSQGTSDATYQSITAQVGDRALVANPERAAVPTLDVRQVFIRGWKAQVDVVRPVSTGQPTGLQQLNTVYLKYDPVANWYVDGIRVWRLSVEDALLQSRPTVDSPKDAPAAEPAK